MERSGELKFIVITNDGSEETMVQLIALKNIFAKQLPKMPKEYIVRLVFDRCVCTRRHGRALAPRARALTVLRQRAAHRLRARGAATTTRSCA